MVKETSLSRVMIYNQDNYEQNNFLGMYNDGQPLNIWGAQVGPLFAQNGIFEIHIFNFI